MNSIVQVADHLSQTAGRGTYLQNTHLVIGNFAGAVSLGQALGFPDGILKDRILVIAALTEIHNRVSTITEPVLQSSGQRSSGSTIRSFAI